MRRSMTLAFQPTRERFEGLLLTPCGTGKTARRDVHTVLVKDGWWGAWASKAYGVKPGALVLRRLIFGLGRG